VVQRADFRLRFDKSTAQAEEIKDGALRVCDGLFSWRINNIGGYASITLKFKLAVFLFFFNPSRSNKGFALYCSIEGQ
jgi:hypothetical protein